MWLLAFRNESELQAVKESFEQEGAQYQAITTGTGGLIAQSQKESPFPHLVLNSEHAVRSMQSLQWAQRNLYPTALISTGIVPSCFKDQPHQYFLPRACCRSAGPLRVGIGHILFEELPFQPDLQRKMAEHLAQSVATDLLFSAEQLKNTAKDLHWVGEHLKCAGADDFSGELLLSGKRLGIKVGCLKTFGDGPAALKNLSEAWLAQIAT